MTQTLLLSYAKVFHEHSLSVACRALDKHQITTFTRNSFKNQSGDTLKLLARNCNHKPGFVKQKSSCSKLLWLSIQISWTLLLRSLFWVNFVNVADVTQNWNNIGPKVEVPTVVLLSTFLISKKLSLSILVVFHKSSLILAYCIFGKSKIEL